MDRFYNTAEFPGCITLVEILETCTKADTHTHTHLEAYLEVLTELGAATLLAVETLVDEAVEFVRAVTTVVVTVTQQRLVKTLPVTTHVGRVITLPLCRRCKRLQFRLCRLKS